MAIQGLEQATIRKTQQAVLRTQSGLETTDDGGLGSLLVRSSPARTTCHVSTVQRERRAGPSTPGGIAGCYNVEGNE